MSQNQNGQEESSNQSVNKWDKYLDDQEEKLGIKGFKYLQMTEEQMRSMSAEECGEAAVIISLLAFKIQKHRNHLNTRAYWCEQKIRKELAPRMAKVNAYSYDERRGIALSQETTINEIDKQRVAAEGSAMRLDYLPTRLELLVQTLLALQMTKRKYREHN